MINNDIIFVMISYLKGDMFMGVFNNKKGFTLVELLVTLIILGMVVGLALNTLNFNINKAGEKTEEVFVDTLKDAMDMYITTQLSSLNSGSLKVFSACSNLINKTHGEVLVHEIRNDDGSYITFNQIIGNSNNNALTVNEFVNPANEGKDDSKFKCNLNAQIKLYRDDDFVYYYYVKKSDLGCLNNISGEYSDVITNLPKLATGGYYTCS